MQTFYHALHNLPMYADCWHRQNHQRIGAIDREADTAVAVYFLKEHLTDFQMTFWNSNKLGLSNHRGFDGKFTRANFNAVNTFHLTLRLNIISREKNTK